MAKGQKRSNREARKPKAKKPSPSAAPATHVPKGKPAPIGPARKG